MAIARAQNPVTAKNNSGTALTTGAFSSSTTSTNAIVVVCWLWSSNSTGTFPTNAVTDNKSNTYTRRQISSQGMSGGTAVTAIFESQNITGGASHTITVTPTGTQSALIVGATEYSGVLTANAQDVGNVASGESASATTGTTATTAQNDEVFIGVGTLQGNINMTENASGSTPASGWTPIVTESDGDNYQSGEAVDVVATATAAADHFWSHTSAPWAGAIETYKAAAAAGRTALLTRSNPLGMNIGMGWRMPI